MVGVRLGSEEIKQLRLMEYEVLDVKLRPSYSSMTYQVL